MAAGDEKAEGRFELSRFEPRLKDTDMVKNGEKW
jgi:hypothetical protein